MCDNSYKDLKMNVVYLYLLELGYLKFSIYDFVKVLFFLIKLRDQEAESDYKICHIFRIPILSLRFSKVQRLFISVLNVLFHLLKI